MNVLFHRNRLIYNAAKLRSSVQKSYDPDFGGQLSSLADNMVVEEVVDVYEVSRFRNGIVVSALGQFFPNFDLCLALFVQLGHMRRWYNLVFKPTEEQYGKPGYLWYCLLTRPDLVAERCEVSGWRESTKYVSIKSQIAGHALLMLIDIQFRST